MNKEAHHPVSFRFQTHSVADLETVNTVLDLILLVDPVE